MKLNIPFTKGKFLDLSLKSQSTFYPLNSTTTTNLLGFDSFASTKQSEQKLINDGYGSNVTVYAIIKRIAEAGADIPKILVDLNDPDEIIEEGEVFDMLQEPGILQGETLTQFDYFEALMTYLLSSGNTYQLGLEATGFGEIWQKMEILPSGVITPVAGDSYRTPIQGYEFTDKTKTFIFDADGIIQTKYVNPTSLGLNSLEGLSPLQAALYSLTGSSDIQKAISIMVKNQGARGVLSNKSDRSLKPEEAQMLSDRANEKIRGIKNFNKVHVSNTEMDYLQIGMSATDLKVIESGVLTDRQLCNAYGVSSRLFNDPANSTFNNVKEASKAMYTNAVLPALNKILEDLNNTWLKQWSEKDGKKYALQNDTSSVEALQADQKIEAEKDKIKMEGITSVLQMQTTAEAKANLLQNDYGFSEDDAALLVAPVGTPNELLETLKGLSPLLANKLVDKLSEQQIASLFS